MFKMATEKLRSRTAQNVGIKRNGADGLSHSRSKPHAIRAEVGNLNMQMNLVGKSIPRKEGRKKVTGAALYVDDLKFDGMLQGVTVRSSVPRGRIKSISFEQPPATADGTDPI